MSGTESERLRRYPLPARGRPIAEVVRKLRWDAAHAAAEFQQMSRNLDAAPDLNAKTRVLFGVDYPTLVQVREGEFDA